MTHTVTVTSKGQLTLPAKIREALGIRQGTRLEVETADGGILLKPVRRLSEMKGAAKKALAGSTPLSQLKALRNSWDREFERREGARS